MKSIVDLNQFTFIPLHGCGNVDIWIKEDYLKNSNVKCLYFKDRDDNTAPAITRDDNVNNVIKTSKREIENYIPYTVVENRFGIQFTDKDNTLKYVHQTSWGMTTRLIGAIIMVHGDNEGLVMPPKVAPVQVCIIPIQQKKEGVLDKAYELRDRLKADFRVKVDDTDKTPGYKFAEAEMRGYPIRVEIGPKDIEANKCVICRRDTREKIEVSLDELEAKVAELMETIQKEMLERARAHREEHTYVARDFAELEKVFTEKSGFVKAMWCGEQTCEDVIKEKLSVTSRCMPFEQEELSDTCVCCGGKAKKMVYWGKAY